MGLFIRNIFILYLFFPDMVMRLTLIIISILVIAIWVIIELKRFKHKIFAIFLIMLLLSAYVSVSFVFKGKDMDFKTVSGVINASKIYLSWLSSALGNVRILTSNAINMDWKSVNSPSNSFGNYSSGR